MQRKRFTNKSLILPMLILTLMPVWLAEAAEEILESKAIFSTLSETAEPLGQDHLEALREAFESKPHYRQMQNAVSVTAVSELALERSTVINMDNSFSHQLDDWSVTAQNKTGRCWIFAGTNLLRVGAMKRMNLKDFQFSQNYLFFWDKIERANYFLEAIIDTADRPDGDRTVDYLLSSPIGDGGQWNMFVSLIKKHGLVPKAAMPETESSSNSSTMNKILKAKLREGAKQLRELHSQGASKQKLWELKHEILTAIYRIVSIHLGRAPEHFDWQWRDEDDEFHRDGKMTPQEFTRKYLTVDLEDYVCLVHDPRPSSPRGRVFTVAYLGNVVGGEAIRYLNVDIKLIKELTKKTLLKGEPVWFGCDVGPQMSREHGIWDKRLFDYEGIYDTKFSMNKADRLIYHESRMTHAMLFTGVDIVDDEPRRWRVENSWGEEVGKDGFFIMNDSWFDEYIFEVAIHKSYLSVELQQALELEPIVLPPWDPMGSLANCERQ